MRVSTIPIHVNEINAVFAKNVTKKRDADRQTETAQ